MLQNADDARKRCKKNSPSVLSCVDKRTKECCDRGSEVGTVTADVTEKGQFLRRNRRNLAKQRAVRKISFPIRMAVCLIYAMTRASGMEIWAKGSVAPILTNEPASSLLGSPLQHDRGPNKILELHGRRGHKYSRRTLVRETPESEGRLNAACLQVM